MTINNPGVEGENINKDADNAIYTGGIAVNSDLDNTVILLDDK